MNINGWEYDYKSLLWWDIHDKVPWCSDKMVSNPHSDTACLIYSIGEVRMCTEMGYLAVLQHENAPKLIINVTSFMFPIQEPFYSKNGRYIILKAQVYIKANNMIECPILFLDVVEMRFASILMKQNNYSYQFEEISPSQYIIKVDEYQKSKGYAVDMIANISDLVWFPLSVLENYEKWR